MKKKRNATQKKSKAKPVVKRPVVFSIGDGPVDEQIPPSAKDDRLRKQQAALGVLARATLASMEREDQLTWEINRRFENEPIPGSVKFSTGR